MADADERRLAGLAPGTSDRVESGLKKRQVKSGRKKTCGSFGAGTACVDAENTCSMVCARSARGGKGLLIVV